MRGGVGKEAVSMSVDNEKTDSTTAAQVKVEMDTIHLTVWEPEDKEFWEKHGKRIAYRNLLISTFALFLGFAIWSQWGGVAKQILVARKKGGADVYPFGETVKKEHTAATKLLGPIGGISGATSRVVHA